MPEKRLISIIVPVLNEVDNVERLVLRVEELFSGITDKYEHEYVFTDNHSDDGTFEKLRILAEENPRIRAYRFSRNFGFQRSILTGYRLAHGDAVVQLDCDLQDPPELILGFLDQWEVGASVVYGVRRNRKEGRLITAARTIFYRAIDYLSDYPLPHDAGDFRLVDRKVITELLKYDDTQPYLRGSIATLGFKQVGLPYDRDARQAGESKFSVSALIKLAVDGILNHSIVPLRIATFTGIALSALMVLVIGVFMVGKFAYGQNWPAGFATTTILILFSLSVNALFLGIIGEYLGRIYQQMKKGPNIIIEAEIGQ